jgi:hypothetical protein
MLLRIIAKIIIGHNRVIDQRDLPGELQTEDRLKGNQATQGTIDTTRAAGLSFWFTLSASSSGHLTFIVHPGHRRTLRRQPHSSGKQDHERKEQYDGV